MKEEKKKKKKKKKKKRRKKRRKGGGGAQWLTGHRGLPARRRQGRRRSASWAEKKTEREGERDSE